MVKVLMVTGYKPFEMGIFKNDDPSVRIIKKALKKALLQKEDEGLEWVLISGQLGVELWSAEVVYELQEEFPQLKLAVLTPFLDQESKWNEQNKEYYEFVISQADFYDSISKQPYQNPQQFRNKDRIFLHKSDELLILYDSEQEGSPKYILESAKLYQKNNEFPIRTIDFYELQTIIEEEQWQQEL
ncbi:DUF1273 domain-containing protein [Falsibacillus albus]|uniref:UPF0398 protein D9X91_11650 n=1 Tax=Falsibacillus albus TaxID=2478915 RepID=A0A3L7JWM3_9BACI|nr:DUF1273 domain-containing protein [Falsibacillus albus]RLQ95146.1 DUF1273 domain-containing protein [Falsibacillus albus]